MLINATQNVNLKVVANYMTGTVESTEEVTTSATVTASAGTYAAGVFTAPATAQTVTLTVTFEGKTGTITVIVNAEPSRIDTVEVTFPATMAEATTTAAVVVVKDQYGAAVTTGFTTGYAVTTGTSTASSLGVVTAGAYDTSVAANNNHVLTVTVTPTSGTALTKTVNFTVTQDTSKPTITKVEALSNKSFRVTYSKKVTSTATTLDNTAADVTNFNFKIYNLTTGIMAGLCTNAPAANPCIQVTATFADANQTVVNYYIQAIGTHSSMTGYPNGGFSSGDFIFYATGVKDSASNTIVANSNYTFKGTLTPDAIAPNMISASYDTEQGILSLTFDKAPAAVSAIDGAKYTITGETSDVVLTNTPGSVSGTYGLSFTLTTEQKATVGVPGSTSKVTIAIGGVKDSADNANTVAQSVDLAVNVRPALKTAVYDEATHRLTLTFNKTIKYTDVITNIANITLKRSGYSGALTSASNVITTSNSDVIVIQLGSVTYTAWEAATVTTPTISILANTVSDLTTPTALQNIAITDYAMTYTKDTTVIAVTSAVYDETLAKLTVTFNKNVSTTVNPAVSDIEIKNGTTSVFNFGAYTYAATPAAGQYNRPNPNQYAFMLTSGTPGTTHKELLRTEYEKVDDISTLALKFAVKANAVKDTLGNNIAAAEPTLTYTDNVKPQVSSATPVGSTTLQIVFNEKVDTTTATTLANYTIAKSDDASLTLAVSGTPQILADKKTVFITTANQQTTTWKLTALNVKDLAANALDSAANNTATFTGSASSTLSLNASTDNKIVDANSNGKLDSGDYMTITFSAPVSLKTGITGTEFSIGGTDIVAGTNANQDQYVFGTGYTIAKGTGPNEVKITFGSKVSGHATDAAWATYLIDKVLNTNSGISAANSKIYITGSDPNVGVTYAIGGNNTIKAPTTSAAPKITAAEFTDVNGNAIVDSGDKLKLTYDQKVVYTADSVVADFIATVGTTGVYDADWVVGGTIGSAAGNTSIAATGSNGNELTLTLGTGANLNQAGSTAWFDKAAKIQMKNTTTAGKIINEFGIAASGGATEAAACTAAVTPTVVSDDNAKPNLVSITKVTVGAGPAWVAEFKYSEKVYVNTGAASSAFVTGHTFTIANGTLVGSAATNVSYKKNTDGTNDYTTAVVTPAAGDAIDQFTTWVVGSAGITTVTDMVGNAGERTSVNPANVVVSGTASTDAFVGTSDELEAAAINSSVTKIYLNNSITLDSDLVVNNGSKTIDLNGKTLTTANAGAAGDQITITANDSVLTNGTVALAVNSIIDGAGTGATIKSVTFNGGNTLTNDGATDRVYESCTFGSTTTASLTATTALTLKGATVNENSTLTTTNNITVTSDITVATGKVLTVVGAADKKLVGSLGTEKITGAGSLATATTVATIEKLVVETSTAVAIATTFKTVKFAFAATETLAVTGALAATLNDCTVYVADALVLTASAHNFTLTATGGQSATLTATADTLTLTGSAVGSSILDVPASATLTIAGAKNLVMGTNGKITTTGNIAAAAATAVLKLNTPTAVVGNQLNISTNMKVDMSALVNADVAKIALKTALMNLVYTFKDEAVLVGTVDTTTGLGEAEGATLDYVIANSAGTNTTAAAWTNQVLGPPTVAPYLTLTAANATDLVQTVTVKTAD